VAAGEVIRNFLEEGEKAEKKVHLLGKEVFD